MKTIAAISTVLLTSGLASIAYAAPGQTSGMMSDPNMIEGCKMMGVGMMTVCILFGLLIFVALVLGIFALIEYLRRKG